MKAYLAKVVHSDSATIVFAKDDLDAKSVVQRVKDAELTDIQVRREPIVDFLYKGKPEIDWEDNQTREYLSRYLEWQCKGMYFDCNHCDAKELCRWFKDEVQDQDEPEEEQ